jgi:glycosyltransferase family protein
MKKILLSIYYFVIKIRDSLTILKNKIIPLLTSPPVVKNTDDTLAEIVNKNVSISRYGDGEFALMNGEDLLFQPHNNLLSARLKEIVRSNKENHIVCIPDVFNSLDWCEEKPRKYWGKYLNLNRIKIYKLLDMNKKYYDSLVTRVYIDQINKNIVKDRFLKFKRLWNRRDVVIVEGEKSRLGLGNDLFDNVNSLQRIICPSSNAFAKYEAILKECLIQDRSKLILVSLGPTATVLSYDLTLNGYQAIDIGHIDIEYEWFLQQVTEKVPIKYKYIGEIKDGIKVKDTKDLVYSKQILCKIV